MAQQPRPMLSFSQVTDDALRGWDDSGSKFRPCPDGGFAGKKVKVFWDMENCPLNASWPPGGGPLELSAHQHYDFLYDVFCQASGVELTDFHVSVSVSIELLQLLGDQAAADIMGFHSEYISVVECAAMDVDTVLKHEIKRYLQNTRPGDILVLISGDMGFVPIIREAFQMYHVQVLQLYPDGANGTGRTAAVWLDGAGRNYVGWAASWGEFLSKHANIG